MLLNLDGNFYQNTSLYSSFDKRKYTHTNMAVLLSQLSFAASTLPLTIPQV